MTNSRLFEIEEEKPVLVTKMETLESDKENKIHLKEIPVDLFIYEKETGKKILPLSKEEKEIGLHFIYDKSERENITDKELQAVLKDNGII